MSARVLAVCSGGGVGDLLAATPAITALARRFGERVAVLTSPYAAPILDAHPAVESVLVDAGGSSDDLLREVKARDFTHAVVFWSTLRVALLVRRARIPVRVGQSRRLYSWWCYNVRVPIRSEDGDVETHWTDIQMDYARALGAQPQAADFAISLPVRPDDNAQAQAALAAAGVREPFLVWHAARGLTGERPQWPVESFAAVGDALGQAFGMPVVLTGSASERASIDRIAGAMRASHANVAGATSLRGLAALLARAHVVVALDSGPMHIAAAVGAPTVGIFALRTDLPKRWRPLGRAVSVVGPEYPCPGCRKETCRTFACYRALNIAAIVAAARSLVAAPLNAAAVS